MFPGAVAVIEDVVHLSVTPITASALGVQRRQVGHADGMAIGQLWWRRALRYHFGGWCQSPWPTFAT